MVHLVSRSAIFQPSQLGGGGVMVRKMVTAGGVTLGQVAGLQMDDLCGLAVRLGLHSQRTVQSCWTT